MPFVYKGKMAGDKNGSANALKFIISDLLDKLIKERFTDQTLGV
jgi:hypothetical protein